MFRLMKGVAAALAATVVFSITHADEQTENDELAKQLMEMVCTVVEDDVAFAVAARAKASNAFELERMVRDYRAERPTNLPKDTPEEGRAAVLTVLDSAGDIADEWLQRHEIDINRAIDQEQSKNGDLDTLAKDVGGSAKSNCLKRLEETKPKDWPKRMEEAQPRGGNKGG
jgi:hypothetical protein